ncbi:RNA-binding transcriptional accessory protein [Anaerotruncus sp. AF02-27]|uniref:Tex family protein n=1 Tax=Anaerotruncus sp. AF02-27 TaxID=2292191 RepID=UPI000E4D8335|nr:Tex family protein [Anaerotruncus sp. AF02-27]RGX56389.1 RNA-binding transcriptional accessory protein [Anaerotruncus sp. AF02-27]
MDFAAILSKEFNIAKNLVENIIALIDEGNTIPFIARYRKEKNGSCDDQVLRELSDRLEYLRGLEKRKQEITDSITEQGKMTEDLAADIAAAETLARLEDIYRPYKQKRRTRATIAKERGLEPLAELILAQDKTSGTAQALAAPFVDPEKEIPTAEDAIAGACDIIAEQVSDSAEGRQRLRLYYQKNAVLRSVAADPDKESVYSTYYDYAEPVAKVPSHRVLALNRGEKEEFLKVAVEVDGGYAAGLLGGLFVKKGSITTGLVQEAVADAYKRLIHPSLEREVRSDLTEMANEQAIKNFGVNLKALLMQPPVKGKTVLAIDPAYRTGCKIAVVDQTGKVLDTTVVYPTPPQNKTVEAKRVLGALIKKHGVQVLSIGNGTASKESEIFAAEMIHELDCGLQYMMVNEAGASVYSASKLAAAEFPDYDVSLRSAVSIARRLQDPLAELVKIDPKSVGVGQYQHDMPPKRLDETLAGVVEDCVNRVGVDLNTASASLLGYVSGLSAAVAKNIVAYREENGEFTSRPQLKKVPKLGPKAYEQCAGFLRIPHAKNVLDNTGVHPESYDAAKTVLESFGYTLADVAGHKISDLPDKVKAQGEAKVAECCGIGVPTLRDIVNELLKPGRDLRDDLPQPMLRSDIMDLKDLKPGMELRGTVRNVIDFGVFVDIGVHQDGLVHISQITNRYIKHPSEVLKVGDIVTVWVISVDVQKKRISLTMKKPKQM